MKGSVAVAVDTLAELAKVRLVGLEGVEMSERLFRHFEEMIHRFPNCCAAIDEDFIPAQTEQAGAKVVRVVGAVDGEEVFAVVVQMMGEDGVERLFR